MYGIDLNQPIEYCYASMRYFKPGEHHVNRIGHEDVLLLVYDGILRFTEDDVSYAIYPGQYHIQKSGSRQLGTEASDSPQYLYIHFHGNWADSSHSLPADGTFSCESLFLLMEKMDLYAHNDFSLTECVSVFFQLLSALYQHNRVVGQADLIADYISKNLHRNISLEELSLKFSYSKNHIVNLFRKEYHMTPVSYLIQKRIERAEWLLESTGYTLEHIAESCGFSDYSHLYKYFIKKHQKTPSQWRQEKKACPYRKKGL